MAIETGDAGAATAPESPAPWSPALRVAFRFAFAYLVLYCFPLPEGLAGLPWDPTEKAWHALVPWLGAHVLRLAAPIQVAQTGSARDVPRSTGRAGGGDPRLSCAS